MNKARAAEIWAQLERHLIERCGLPNGRMLEVNRPYLIRWIGGRLKATPVDVNKTVKVKLREHWHDNKHFDLTPLVRSEAEVKELKDEVALNRRINDTINDVRLAAMLERSCSRRMGYDGDDVVDYEGH